MLSVVVPYLGLNEATIMEKEINKIFPQAQVVLSEGSLGKGIALKNGSEEYNLKGDVIVWIDADIQIHPKQIDRLLRYMLINDADAVIGNKRHAYSIVDYPFTRKIISHTYNLLIRALFGFNLRDTQCGLKIFKREALFAIIDKVNSQGFSFDLEVIVALQQNKFMVVDAPVVVVTSEGKGSVTVKRIWETFVETLKIWNRKNNKYYVQK